MKILHCCLANYYIDNNSFQENILTKMHKLQGHDVTILASTETFIQNTKLGYVTPSEYFNEHNIPVIRIPYSKWLPHGLAKKIRLYNGISEVLVKNCPDIIFLHGFQFLSISKIVSYKQKYPNTIIYVDSHTDYINAKWNVHTLKAIVSKIILHKIIYKYCGKVIEPHAKYFFGTLPIRSTFLSDVYKISTKKIKLLEMGFDDSIINLIDKNQIRKYLRQKHNIAKNNLVLITGGKINKGKNIINLIKSVTLLNIDDIKLFICGVPDEELKAEFELNVSSSIHIIYLGWLSTKQIYEYFFASDVGIFPGKHSVLWEQAIGVGLPCIFRKWEGMNHLDLGGNCIFLEIGDTDEIIKHIKLLYFRKDLLIEMKKVTEEKGKVKFSYSEIAKKSIDYHV